MIVFGNPYSRVTGFIPLGPYKFSRVTTTETGATQLVSEAYDLYAIMSQANQVSFGARYGEGEGEYLSGSAYKKQDGQWELTVFGPTAIAAARFFANHFERLT